MPHPITRAAKALLSAAALTLAAGTAGAATLPLTPAEAEWIRAHPVVRVGFSPAYPPYSFPDDSGKMQGIDLEYLDLIARRTGLRFEPVVAPDWPTAEQYFREGRVDLLTLLIGSAEQRESMLLTRVYLSVPRVIVSRTNMPYLLSARDLRGLSVGMVRGYLPKDGPIREMMAGTRLVEFDTITDVLEALARGDIDATLADSVNAAYTIKANHLGNLRLGSITETARDTYLGVARDQPLLLSILNKALADITAAERRQIDERWVSVDANPSPWLLAFKIALAAVAVVSLIVLAVYLHNRRLARELAERRRILARLEEAHVRLAKISEQKTEMLRMVAHDIRGPLTAMLLAADLANFVEQGDEKALRDLLARFRRTAQQLRRLVNDLVDAQATEDGVRRYAREPVDFGALIRDVASTLQESAAGKGIELRVETEDAVMPVVSDAAALRQIADNLVSNALKFTRPGTIVTVSACWRQDGIRLLVSDQGPGIRPEDRARIFTRYGQGESRPTGGEKSTGLGLWIVDNVVTGLGGTLRCESEPGQGAIFIVELPGVRGPVATAV